MLFVVVIKKKICAYERNSYAQIFRLISYFTFLSGRFD